MDDRMILEEGLEQMGISCRREQLKSLLDYTDLILEKNRLVNLIGPAGSSDIIRRHILDCLAPLSQRIGRSWLEKGASILDIGSGAGLPGIPLAVMLKEAEVFLLEKSSKRSAFLKQAKRALLADNLTIITGRAEELAHEPEWRERFQAVTARAVARFNILLELSIPFCRINGKIIFYKSRKVFDETKAMDNALDLLGARMGELVEVEVPGLDEFRALLAINKEKNTPEKFPRRFSQIKKKPL